MKTAEDWLAKYYPISAEEAAKGSWTDALDHSIRKWSGLDEKTLAEYGLRAGEMEMDFDGETIYIVSQDACALCIKADFDCLECPLYEVRGGRCHEPIPMHGPSPYKSFMVHGDPQPMLRLLMRARKAHESNVTGLSGTAPSNAARGGAPPQAARHAVARAGPPAVTVTRRSPRGGGIITCGTAHAAGNTGESFSDSMRGPCLGRTTKQKPRLQPGRKAITR